MSKKARFTSKFGDVSPTFLEHTREYFEPLEYYQPISYKNVSRYKSLRTLKDADNGRMYHESWKIQGVPESDNEDNYYTVTIDTENRLDLIAYSYYGSARYWWVVALANNILDPFTVPIGTRLRIPPMITLYKPGGVLNG